MAHTKQMKKRIRQNERLRVRNMAVNSRVKTYVKLATAAMEAKDQAAMKAAIPAALTEIDRAAKKGVIHKNSAARKKSSLQRKAAAIQ